MRHTETQTSLKLPLDIGFLTCPGTGQTNIDRDALRRQPVTNVSAHLHTLVTGQSENEQHMRICVCRPAGASAERGDWQKEFSLHCRKKTSKGSERKIKAEQLDSVPSPCKFNTIIFVSISTAYCRSEAGERCGTLFCGSAAAELLYVHSAVKKALDNFLLNNCDGSIIHHKDFSASAYSHCLAKVVQVFYL